MPLLHPITFLPGNCVKLNTYFFSSEFNAMKGETCSEKKGCEHPKTDDEESKKQSHHLQIQFLKFCGA